MIKSHLRIGIVVASIALIGAGCYKATTTNTGSYGSNPQNANSAANETLNANAATNANAAVTNENANASDTNGLVVNTNATTSNANTTVTNTNSTTGTTNTATAPENKSVTIQNYAFSPSSLTVKKGATVTWTNQDSVQHTVTGDTSGGPGSSLLGNGQAYSYTFNSTGTFSYHCTPHSYMTATVTVTE